jgi:O-methyltransferase involved in polyketide biosynthesis
MQTMKLSEALNTFNGEAFLFGGKAAGRKNPKKELVTVTAELQPRGIVKLFAEDGTEVLHSRTGTVVFAGPVDGQAAAEEPKKAPRKKAAKKAVKAPETAYATPEDRDNAEAVKAAGLKVVEIVAEAPKKKPGKAPWNFRDLARTAATASARAHWQSVCDEYEG